jgi:hypothetical protein
LFADAVYAVEEKRLGQPAVIGGAGEARANLFVAVDG